jgi:drug/metabolite transporter (DMT)-like permease
MQPGSVVRLATLALLWGSGFLWIKISLRGLSPVQLTLARLALGAAVLLVILLARRQTTPHDRGLWGHLLVAAFFANALPYTLFGVGEEHVASNIAGVLNATTPLWTLLVGVITRHERRISAAQVAGLLLGFAGTLLIFSPWRSSGEIDPLGAAACLAASASYGISFVYMDQYLAGRGLSPLTLSAWQLTAATGLLLAASPFGLQAPHLRPDVVAAVLVLGVFGTGFAYVLNYRLITDEGATVTSTVTYLLPIVSVTLGAVVLGEAFTVSVTLGMAVVLAGVALARRRPADAAASS